MMLPHRAFVDRSASASRSLRPVRALVGAKDSSTVSVETPTVSLWSMLGATSGVAIGYARSSSIGWALGWGLLGGMVPVLPLGLIAFSLLTSRTPFGGIK
jgi:hypothetical protein